MISIAHWLAIPAQAGPFWNPQILRDLLWTSEGGRVLVGHALELRAGERVRVADIDVFLAKLESGVGRDLELRALLEKQAELYGTLEIDEFLTRQQAEDFYFVLARPGAGRSYRESVREFRRAQSVELQRHSSGTRAGVLWMEPAGPRSSLLSLEKTGGD